MKNVFLVIFPILCFTNVNAQSQSSPIRSNNGNRSAPAIWITLMDFVLPHTSFNEILTTQLNKKKPVYWEVDYDYVKKINKNYNNPSSSNSVFVDKKKYYGTCSLENIKNYRMDRMYCFFKIKPGSYIKDSTNLITKLIVNHTPAADILNILEDGPHTSADKLIMHIKENDYIDESEPPILSEIQYSTTLYTHAMDFVINLANKHELDIINTIIEYMPIVPILIGRRVLETKIKYKNVKILSINKKSTINMADIIRLLNIAENLDTRRKNAFSKMVIHELYKDIIVNPYDLKINQEMMEIIENATNEKQQPLNFYFPSGMPATISKHETHSSFVPVNLNVGISPMAEETSEFFPSNGYYQILRHIDEIYDAIQYLEKNDTQTMESMKPYYKKLKIIFNPYMLPFVLFGNSANYPRLLNIRALFIEYMTKPKCDLVTSNNVIYRMNNVYKNYINQRCDHFALLDRGNGLNIFDYITASGLLSSSDTNSQFYKDLNNIFNKSQIKWSFNIDGNDIILKRGMSGIGGFTLELFAALMPKSNDYSTPQMHTATTPADFFFSRANKSINVISKNIEKIIILNDNQVVLKTLMKTIVVCCRSSSYSIDSLALQKSTNLIRNMLVSVFEANNNDDIVKNTVLEITQEVISHFGIHISRIEDLLNINCQ